MKRAAVATTARSKSRAAKPQAAERQQRTRPFPALVPNHVRAGAYAAGDVTAAVEIGRAAPRIDVPHAPALRAVFGNRTRIERLEAHAGPAARLACELLGAQAFAVRNVLVFREAQPGLSRVLHEVAHALQQGGDRETAPRRFEPGSLELKPLSSSAEEQAEACAAGVLTGLSYAPLGVYRDTNSDIEATKERLLAMMELPDWAVKNYGTDSAEARFAVTADEKDRRRIFKYASPKPFRRGDLQRAAVVAGDAAASLEQASKDIENIFKPNPSAKDSLAQKGIRLGKVLYRIAKIQTSPTVEILSLYAFYGTTYTPNDKYYDKIVDRHRGESNDTEPEVKLADYAGILKDVIAKATKLKKGQKLIDGVQNVIDSIKKTLAEDLEAGPLNERLSKIRADMMTALLKLYPGLDELHENLIASGVFGKYTSLQGRLFEEWYLGKYGKKYDLSEQPIFGDKLGESVVKSQHLHKVRRGDFAFKLKNKFYIKELKAIGEPRDPEPEEQLQMQDYKTIFTKKIPGYLLIDDKLEPRVFKGVEYEFSDQKRLDTAKRWQTFLNKLLGTKWYTVVPNPSAPKKVKSKVKGKKSPTLVFTIEDSDKLVHDFTETQLASAVTQRPGLKLKSAHIELAYERDPRIKSGSFTMDVDMGGQVTKPGDVKTIEPRPEEAGESQSAAPKSTLKETAPDGYFDVKVDKMGSALDKVFARLETDADVTDEGLVARLRVLPGESGIPGFLTVAGTEISATLTKNRFALKGGVAIKHKTRDITGDVTVEWDSKSKAVKVVGTATAKKLIPIVDEITLQLTYVSAPKSKWDVKVKKLDASKKIGPVSLRVTATDLSFDGDAGGVSAESVGLKASMPAIGELSATAAIHNNEVTEATFEYKSARFLYPKGKSVIDGTVDGKVTYSKGKFSGGIHGKATITSGVIKKLGKVDELKLAIVANFAPDGSFSGTIRTESALDLGDHFRVSAIEGTLNAEGDVSASFTVQLVKLKLPRIKLEKAEISCTISSAGLRVDNADLKLAFGDPETDRVSGTVTFVSRNNDFVLGASIDVRIKKGLVAHGEATYDIGRRKGSATLSLKSPENPEGKIQLLSFAPSKPIRLFGIGPKQFVLFTILVGGVYIEFEFQVFFNYGLDFWVKPTLSLTGLDFGTMGFDSISAEMWMGGDLKASLAAVPKLGIGLFLGHPALLRGGGGLAFKIEALARLTPSGKFNVVYAKRPDGEYDTSGNARLALAMTFGITADLIPSADFVVLSGVYTAKWEGDSLASFVLLPPRELFTYVVDFGKPLENEKNPALPKGSGESPKVSAKETLRSSIGGEKKDAETPKADVDSKESSSGQLEKPTGEEEGFSISGMLKGLLDQPRLKGVKELIEAAEKIYKAVGAVIKFLYKIVKFWLGGALDLVRAFLKMVADTGGIFKPIKAYLKKRVNETLFYVIEPMLDMFVKQEEKFLKLIGRELPDSFSGWVDWTLESIELLLDLSWGGLLDFISAVREMASRFSEVLGYLLNGLVQVGTLGVKRHEYDFGVTEKWMSDEWKVPTGGGDWIGGYNPLPVANPFSTAVAAPLYAILDEFDAVEHTDRGPAWNFWRKVKPNGNGMAPDAPRAVHYAVRSSYGVPLPLHLARKYEPKLGVRLSGVRVHHDLAANAAAEALNARAFAVGQDIYFGRGEYAPRTRRGELLLAHEVVHVAQHTRDAATQAPTPIAVTTAERHADALARTLVEETPRRLSPTSTDERYEARLARARRQAA